MVFFFLTGFLTVKGVVLVVLVIFGLVLVAGFGVGIVSDFAVAEAGACRGAFGLVRIAGGIVSVKGDNKSHNPAKKVTEPGTARIG